MFICKECLKSYTHPLAITSSYGRCEVCGTLTGCYDIPSIKLILKNRTDDEMISIAINKYLENTDCNDTISDLRKQLNEVLQGYRSQMTTNGIGDSMLTQSDYDSVAFGFASCALFMIKRQRHDVERDMIRLKEVLKVLQ